MKLKQLGLALKGAAKDWSDDNASRLAAALAYYTLLSLAPLVVISIAVAGAVLGDEAARGQISAQMSSVVGPEAARGLESVVDSARAPTSGIIGTVIGIVTLLLGASGAFGELQASLNTIWEVEPKPNRGFWGMIKDRFFSFSMVLVVAFLLLVSLVLSAALAAVGNFFSHTLPGGELLWQVLNILISLAIITALFALIFKVVPDAEVAWRDVWVGALLTAVLFTIGKLLLGLYLGKSSMESSYGAAGSLVALVVWVYYTSQIVFFGAEFTQQQARLNGREIKPSANAVEESADRARRLSPRSS
jgi:membrane protein